jgi:formylglycine-generating enzyme required for sulfatase activity
LSSELDRLRITFVGLLAPEQVGSPMVALAGGTIVIGSGSPMTQTPVTLQVAAFSMERTEVTNRQYRLCVQARRCMLPFHTAPNEDSAARDEYPVVDVTAHQAAEYCVWLGRRLPTTVEWERAARGLTGRRWPWGDDPPSPAKANYNYAMGNTGLVMVGSYSSAATPDGILNLAGNAAEWTASVCKSGDCSLIWSGSVPTGLTVRGGSWRTMPGSDITDVLFAQSTFASDSIGFRCVQSAPGK